MINMLRAPMEKVNNIQERMGNITKEMEMLRQNQKEMLEIRNTVRNKECPQWVHRETQHSLGKNQ